MNRGFWSPRGVLLLACTSGCDLLFQVDRIGDRRDGGPPSGDTATIDTATTDTLADTVGVDAPPIDCSQPVIDDTFTGPGRCDNWGAPPYTSGNATITANGELVITPAPATMNSWAGCKSTTPYPFGGGGIVVAVNGVILGASAFTMLQLTFGATRYQMIVTGDNKLRFQTAPGADVMTTTFNSQTMKWWRLRPLSRVVAAEYSSDGAQWLPFGYAPLPGGSVVFDLSAGVNSGYFSTNAAFDRLIVCP
jgi:hypothetical protein